jgi:hypothetical protein
MNNPIKPFFTSYSVSQVLEQSDFIRDRLIRVEGCGHLLRLAV